MCLFRMIWFQSLLGAVALEPKVLVRIISGDENSGINSIWNRSPGLEPKVLTPRTPESKVLLPEVPEDEVLVLIESGS